MKKESNRHVLLWKRINHKENGGFIDAESRAQLFAREKSVSVDRALLLINSQDRARVYPEYFMTVLGDALSTEKGWSVKGLDAIVYALTDRYGWKPEEVRRMGFRDQWLALPDQAKQVPLDQSALQAWQQAYESPIDEPGEAAWTIHDVSASG